MTKCENCGSVLKEDQLIYDGEEDMDFCPNCGEGNCFIDITADKI